MPGLSFKEALALTWKNRLVTLERLAEEALAEAEERAYKELL